MITFIRRRGLGFKSVKAIVHYLNEHYNIEAQEWRNDRPSPAGDTDLIFRWGCTSTLPYNLKGAKVINEAKAIHNVNDKSAFAIECQDIHENWPVYIDGVPPDNDHYPVVVRPPHHSRGKNLAVARTPMDIRAIVAGKGFQKWGGRYYARPLVDKVAEYRIYVMKGRVLNVAKKTPGNPDDVAWNVAQGGRFDNCRWDDWPLEACNKALQAHERSGLDFSAVDIMLDKDNCSYIIELNSAPTLPYNEDGSISYRQKCMAQSIKYHLDNDWSHKETPQTVRNWRDVIHPGIWNDGKVEARF